MKKSVLILKEVHPPACADFGKELSRAVTGWLVRELRGI